MNQKTWKSAIFYYAAAFLLILACLIFLQNRTKPALENSEVNSSDLRIVSMAPDLTEILFALDLGDNIVAVSSDSNYPEQALTKKKAGTFWNPDLEAVLSVQPTLVFALQDRQQGDLAKQLKRIGCQTVSLKMETLAQMYRSIQTIGSRTNREDRADRLVRQITDGLEKYKDLSAGATAAKVLWVVQRQPLRAASENTFFNELLKIAGAQNAVRTTLFQYPPLDEEQLIAAAPDIIIETADKPEDLRRLQATAQTFYARFKTVPAVGNNRIYAIDGDLLCRLGPRLPLGMKALVECIHPSTSQGNPSDADF
ncbi:MAG TPA: helical backbone metal receptor [Anaerohalosphaeraceae bacterium]|jgi:iron complex transport system substrate-binding protein|nr:helical backbone metal receptor [Anaerohalosphaeraceae bacterium]